MSRGLPTYAAEEWERVRARLFSHVERQPLRPDQDIGCLEWQGSTDKGGYGITYVPTLIRPAGWPPHTSTHRLSCFLAHGAPQSPKSQARHLCHNPPCVEPTHLAWGSTRQNVNDSLVAERYRNKLTRDQVDWIRDAYAAGGETIVGLADRYGVSKSAIHSVITGRTWRWTLTSDQLASLATPSPPPAVAPRAPLTDRLAWFAPTTPDGMTEDDHVNRWVLDMALQHGTTPTEAVEAILSGQWATEHRTTPETVDKLDTTAVLAYAAEHGISTSDAANVLAAPR